MRRNLKDLSNAEHQFLFVELHKTWCYNPAATSSLCLIAEVYHHAYDLVCAFASLEIVTMSDSQLPEMDRMIIFKPYIIEQ